MSIDVARVATNLPTPYLGITERTMMAAWLLWMAVLSMTLLRGNRIIPAVRLRLQGE